MPTKRECASEMRTIPEYDGYYATVDGTVISYKSGKPKRLKPIRASDGHLYVFLYDGNGHSDKVWLHRAILLAFEGRPMDGQECRHLDGNPANNHRDNLKWGTHMENVEDRRRHGRMPVSHLSQFTKLRPYDIPEIRALHGILSSRRVAARFGTSHVTIQKIWRNERWKGY